MNTWILQDGVWMVKAPGASRGQTVTVTKRSGQTSEVRLGHEFRPDVFYVGTPIPTSMSAATVEGGPYDYHRMWFEVDGKKFYHQGCCKLVWEGPTRSGDMSVEFGCSVLADTFHVCMKDADGRYTKDPYYCGFKGFARAVEAVREYWANN